SGLISRVRRLAWGHPAPFPTELASRLIRMFSFAGDTILDPFMGTGSTGVAALEAGRNFIGAEIESAYLKLAHTRIDMAAKEKSRQFRHPSLSTQSCRRH